jgi:hypothetical protein
MRSITSDDAALHDLDRRSFLKLGFAGTVALSTISVGAGLAGCHRAQEATAAGYAALRDADVRLLSALVPVILAGALPTEPVVRAAQLTETLKRLDGALQRVGTPTLKELRKLFDLLNFPITRRLVAGLPVKWQDASPDQLEAFLQRWRGSSVAAFNAGYRALTKLVTVMYFQIPATWPQSGYPGPLAWVYQSVNS